MAIQLMIRQLNFGTGGNEREAKAPFGVCGAYDITTVLGGPCELA